MRRIGGIAILLAGLLAVLTPGVAMGAQTLGQTGPAVTCNDNRPWVPVTGIAGYTAPNHGVITSWSTMGGSTANRSLKLLVLQPHGGTVYSAAQKDVVRTIATTSLNTFPVRIPMEAGQVLGLFVPAGQPGGASTCAFGAPGDAIRTSATLGEPALASPVDYNDPRVGARPNVSGLLEPDADRDGFGDDSQDACDVSAKTQSLCACKNRPATIAGGPGKDRLIGTPGADVMDGLGGKDTIKGRKGNDIICGGAGKDKIIGGAGKDKLLGGPGKDTQVQ